MTRLALTLALMLCAMPLHAMEPEYYSSRDAIKEKALTAPNHLQSVIYVGSVDTKKFFVLELTAKITIKQIVKMTQFGKVDVGIVILRKPPSFTSPPASIHKFLKNGEDLPFSFHEGDVIWICDPNDPD